MSIQSIRDKSSGLGKRARKQWFYAALITSFLMLIITIIGLTVPDTETGAIKEYGSLFGFVVTGFVAYLLRGTRNQ